jgi:hypothetical protein
MPDSSQVKEFIATVEPVLNPTGEQQTDYDAPKVPFQTALKLSGEQEKKMIEHAFKRKRDIEIELGLDQSSPKPQNPMSLNNLVYLMNQIQEVS